MKFPVVILAAFIAFVGIEVAVYQSNPANDPNSHLYRSGVNYLNQRHINTAKYSKAQIIAKGKTLDNDALDHYAAEREYLQGH